MFYFGSAGQAYPKSLALYAVSHRRTLILSAALQSNALGYFWTLLGYFFEPVGYFLTLLGYFFLSAWLLFPDICNTHTHFFTQNPLFQSNFDELYICQQDQIHHQGIDDGRDGDDLVIENERTARDSDRLRGILHPDLDDQRSTFLAGQF